MLQKDSPASYFSGYFRKSYRVFEQLYCYQVILVKKYNKPLLQKCDTKVFDQKKVSKKAGSK